MPRWPVLIFIALLALADLAAAIWLGVLWREREAARLAPLTGPAAAAGTTPSGAPTLAGGARPPAPSLAPTLAPTLTTTLTTTLTPTLTPTLVAGAAAGLPMAPMPGR